MYAGWVQPQRRAADPAASVRLQVDPASGRYEAMHQLPESAVFGRRLLLDSDERLTLEEGSSYSKTLYLYAAARRAGTVFRPGYCDSLSAAWRQLYPTSPTNPPHTLRADYELRLRTTLDDHGLIQEIARGGRTYRVFYVGRWVYGDAPTGDGRFLPKEYFHRFVGFSWSGMAGLVAHAALDHGLRHDNADAVRVAVDTMDFFAEHGMSPLGILYPTYHEDHAGLVDTFGTYYDPGRIDMGPLGEGLYWYLRCAERLRRHGSEPPASWIAAVRSSLDRIMELFPDGDVPGRIDGTSAEPAARRIQLLYWERSRWTERQTRAADIRFTRPSERGATNFVYLTWAYVRAGRYLGEQRYLDYAVVLGELALRVMERFGVFAGSEMDFYNIDKRQGHALLAAHNELYAATGEARWLAAAEVAASWFGSWQYHFNACTDGLDHLPLGRWDYRTVGGNHRRHQVLHQQPGVCPRGDGAAEPVAPHRRRGVVRARPRAAAPGRAELAHRGKAALAQRPLPVGGASAGAARLQPGRPIRRRLPRRRHRGRAAGMALPRQLDHQVRGDPEHVHAGRGARRRSHPEPLRRHHLPPRESAGAGLGRCPGDSRSGAGLALGRQRHHRSAQHGAAGRTL